MNFQFCINFITCRLPDSVRFGTNALAAVQSIKRLIFVEAVSANKQNLPKRNKQCSGRSMGSRGLDQRSPHTLLPLKVADDRRSEKGGIIFGGTVFASKNIVITAQRSGLKPP